MYGLGCMLESGLALKLELGLGGLVHKLASGLRSSRSYVTARGRAAILVKL